MAIPEQTGKRWHIRKADGTIMISSKTGKVKYFNTLEMAEFTAEIITAREQNPRPPRLREALDNVTREGG